MAAIMQMDPSLIQYVGGFGKGMSSIGNSMVNVGQAKLALEQKKAENDRAQAMLGLAQGADTREANKLEDAKNSRFATNSMLYQAYGKEMPQELTPEYAQLMLADPKTVAATLKPKEQKFNGTAGGIIYNENTGEIKGDYRVDKGSNDPLKGLPYLEGVDSKGHPVRTYFNQDGTPKMNLVAPSMNSGTYNIGYADGVGDNNVPQRTTLQKNTNDGIEVNGHVEKGFLPIRLTGNPVIDKKMKEFAVPKGGGWYVPPTLVNDFMKQFPSKE